MKVLTPSSRAVELTAMLWALSDPNPTRGTDALFPIVTLNDGTTCLEVDTEFSLPILEDAEQNGIADLLRPWVGHGILQSDIDRLEQLVVEQRGQRLGVYGAFPLIFKLKDESNPTGLGRTRAELVKEGKLDAPKPLA